MSKQTSSKIISSKTTSSSITSTNIISRNISGQMDISFRMDIRGNSGNPIIIDNLSDLSDNDSDTSDSSESSDSSHKHQNKQNKSNKAIKPNHSDQPVQPDQNNSEQPDYIQLDRYQSYKLYLKKKVSVGIITIEIDTFTHKDNNIVWSDMLFDYDKIMMNDLEELLKLFYYLDYKDDFNNLQYVHKSPKTKRFIIETALNYRDDNIIKQYISELSIEDLTNKTNDYDLNIIEKLASHGYICGNEADRSYYKKMNHPNEDPEILNIIEYILQIRPKLITKQAYDTANHYNNNQIIKLFDKYSSSDDEQCYICMLSSDQEMLITDICMCKMNIHYNCAVDLIKKNGDICRTCNKPFERNEKIYVMTVDNKPMLEPYIYFPKIGYFPVPFLPGKHMVTTTHFDKLIFAIIYLQTNTVFDIFSLLKSNEKEEIKYNFHIFLTKNDNGLGSVVNGKFVMIEHLGSNATKLFNEIKYNQITQIINYNFFE
jgi:hypothetical protein